MMSPSTDRGDMKLLQAKYDQLLTCMERIAEGWHLWWCPQQDRCLCGRTIADRMTREDGRFRDVVLQHVVRKGER